MADSRLTQAEADALIALEKRRVGEEEWRYPDFAAAITIPLVSTNRREPFLLDLRRSRIDLAKNTYQNRGRQIVVLVRLDLGARPHRNPDGRRSVRRIFTSTARATATSGRIRRRRIGSPIWRSPRGRSMISCSSAISSSRLSSDGGCSHDGGSAGVAGSVPRLAA